MNKDSSYAGQNYEIDWFDFETRMRKMIHEMIEPTVRKVNEDRDKLFKIRNDQDAQKRKIEDLEFAVIKTDNKTNVFEDIFRNLARLVNSTFHINLQETDIKVEQNRVDNEFDRLQIQSDNIHFEIKNQNQQWQTLNSYVERIHSEVQIFNQTFIGYKEKNIESIAGLQQDFTDQLDRFSKNIIDMGMDISRIETLVKHHGNLLTKLDSMCYAQVQRTQDLQSELTDTKSNFVTQVIYKKEMEEVEKRFDRMIIQLEDQINQNLGLHNFVEKYLPIRTQQMISETMNAVCDNDTKKKLYDFDKNKYQEFNVTILKDNGKHQLQKEIEKINQQVQETVIGIKKPVFLVKDNKKPDRASETKLNEVAPNETGYVSVLQRKQLGLQKQDSGNKNKSGGMFSAVGSNSLSRRVTDGGSEKKIWGGALKTQQIIEDEKDDEDYFGTQEVKSIRDRSRIDRSAQKPSARQNLSSQRSNKSIRQNQPSGLGMKSGDSSNKNRKVRKDSESRSPKKIDSQMIVGSQDFNSLVQNSNQSSSNTLHPGNLSNGIQGSQQDLQSQAINVAHDSVIERTDEDDNLSSYPEEQYNGMHNAISNERLEEFQQEMNKIKEDLEIQMKKITYQMSNNSTQNYIEQENIKKNLYSVENQLQQQISQIQIELEQFLRARKRDKSDQNVLLDSLTSKIDGCASQLAGNKQAISNLSTLVVLFLEVIQMQVCTEEQDESDRSSIALLGYRDNTQDNVQKNKHSFQSNNFNHINEGQNTQQNLGFPMPQQNSKKRSTSNVNGVGNERQNTSHSILLSNNIDDSLLYNGPTKFLSDGNEKNYTSTVQKKNVMALDPKCISCSGQGSSLISTFKLACLAYAPSPVIFRKHGLTTKKLFDDTYLYFMGIHQRKQTSSLDHSNLAPSIQEIAQATFDYMTSNSRQPGGAAITAYKSPLSVIDYDLREDLYSPNRFSGGNGVIGSINMVTNSGRKSNISKYVNKKNNDSVDRQTNTSHKDTLRQSSIYESITDDLEQPDQASRTIYAGNGGTTSSMSGTGQNYFQKQKMSAKFSRDAANLAQQKITTSVGQSNLTSPRDGPLVAKKANISQTPALKNVNFNNLPPLTEGKNKMI
ncbi:UNKNOWN [Stylonychia lemnae]|uniref:Uncharacterized protein n=1 Tax=Stylonychia lemnae TaxID=5949 RepID=A0A078AF76_STYLE|nr:UNKNOWN [Stylonychia lemnae]|eukprot:CDW80865.1 UNKNOWN [Stylonychia lemnae]